MIFAIYQHPYSVGYQKPKEMNDNKERTFDDDFVYADPFKKQFKVIIWDETITRNEPLLQPIREH